MKYRFNYEGDLRTRMIHGASGSEVLTDAPEDNKGKGRFFSPTDLLSASLVSCMMTIIGITAEEHGIELRSMEASAEKKMGSNPRRVVGIDVAISIYCIPNNARTERLLQTAALTCPVAKSLHPEIEQTVRFLFTEPR